jgi:hypothetical protein
VHALVQLSQPQVARRPVAPRRHHRLIGLQRCEYSKQRTHEKCRSTEQGDQPAFLMRSKLVLRAATTVLSASSAASTANSSTVRRTAYRQCAVGMCNSVVSWWVTLRRDHHPIGLQRCGYSEQRTHESAGVCSSGFSQRVVKYSTLLLCAAAISATSPAIRHSKQCTNNVGSASYVCKVLRQDRSTIGEQR